MPGYHIQRAFEILREQGPVELCKKISKFFKNRLKTNLKRNPTYFRIQNRFKQRLNGYSAIADPFKTITVSPDDVNHYSLEFKKWESVGLIVKGDWDKKTMSVEDMMKYKAVKKRFQENMSWEDTGIIDHHCQRLTESDETYVDGCCNRSEYKQWYDEGIDRLYTSIKNNGYNKNKHSTYDYIAVHIGRNGELIFAGSGCHRLSICKILDINNIPVWARARHEKWQEIRDEIHSNGLSKQHCNELRNHPDLQDVIN